MYETGSFADNTLRRARPERSNTEAYVLTVDGDPDQTPEPTFARINNWATRNQESLGLPSLGEGFAKLDDSVLETKFPARYKIMQRMREAMAHGQFPKLEDQRRMMKTLYVLNSLDRYISAHHAAEAGQKVLHSGQVIAFEKLSEKVEQGLTSGYFKYPMGFGKTVLFAKLVEAMNVRPPQEASKELHEIAHTRTLIVVPTLSLVGQTMRRMAKFTPGLTIGRSTSRRALLKQNATIITHAALKSRVKSGRLNPKDFDLLLIDEAHEMTTTLGKEAIAPFREHAMILGFTATDEYGPDKNVSLILGEKIHSIDLEEAVRSEYICDFDAYEFDTKIDLSEVKRLADGSPDPKDMAKRISFGKRAQCALDFYNTMFPEEQGFAFVESIKAANITAQVFNEAGISAVALTQATPNPDALIQAFERGEFKVLVSINIGTRGVDNDKAAFVMSLSETTSPVKEEQRGGRSLRRCAERPDKKAGIISFVYRDKRRGDPVTFARIAKREPLKLSSQYDMHAEVRRSERHNEQVTPPDDLPLDQVSDIEPVLREMTSIERQTDEAGDEAELYELTTGDIDTASDEDNHENSEQQDLEAEIFELVTDIDDLFVRFTTERLVHELKEATVLAAHRAREQRNKPAEQKHDSDYFKLYEIEGELRALMDQAYQLVDPLFTLEAAEQATVTRLQEVRETILEWRSLAELFYEEAQLVAFDYDMDITDFDEGILHS